MDKMEIISRQITRLEKLQENNADRGYIVSVSQQILEYLKFAFEKKTASIQATGLEINSIDHHFGVNFHDEYGKMKQELEEVAVRVKDKLKEYHERNKYQM